MALPVGLQLYTLRDALAQDYEGVVRRVAEMGYAGVEPAGFPGTTVEKAAALFRSLGLDVPGAHTPLPLGEQRSEVLETMAALGCRYLICPYMPPEEFATPDKVKAMCDRLNEANEIARGAGLTLVYHNHWWEYEPVNGFVPYQMMLEWLDPTIQFEIDTYWVKTAGADPVAVVSELGARVPLLHIKDGPLDKDAPMVAVGQGKMEFEPIIRAGAEAVQWLIVELDRCATDMLEAVAQSYDYLTNRGLARGKQD